MEGGSNSTSEGGSGTTVEMLSNHNNRNPNQMNIEVGIEGSDDSELDLGLGLGLSLGGVMGLRNSKQIPRIFTAKDLPSLLSRPVAVPPSSSTSSCSSMGLRTPSPPTNSADTRGNDKNSTVGTKRAASPTGTSQAVGWPPVKTYRMNNMANQAKSIATEEHNGEFEENKEDMIYGNGENGNAKFKERIPIKSSLFVKVRMDGDPIGRKIDLNALSSYDSLSLTLEEMFINTSIEKSDESELVLMPRPSKLLNGSSEHVLTYEDKDGDWMLVGDVPWRMFVSSVKRLRIMRTSEANGLAPRSEEIEGASSPTYESPQIGF